MINGDCFIHGCLTVIAGLGCILQVSIFPLLHECFLILTEPLRSATARIFVNIIALKVEVLVIASTRAAASPVLSLKRQGKSSSKSRAIRYLFSIA